MTRTLLVVPTNARVGLTSTCLGVVAALERRGVEVGFAKPVAQPQHGEADRSAELVRLLTPLDPPSPVPAEKAEAMLRERRADARVRLRAARAPGRLAGDDARVRVLVVVADEAAEIVAQAVALVSPRGA